MFSHDKNGKASFRPKGVGGMSRGSKEMGEPSSKPAAKPMPNRNEQQAPHEGHNVPHVTETHPGKTQPHPKTGVHAFHAHHTGGGQYESETHHDGGNVEVQQHQNAGDMHNAMNTALPDDNEGQQDQMADDDYGMDLGSVGGGDNQSEG